MLSDCQYFHRTELSSTYKHSNVWAVALTQQFQGKLQVAMRTVTVQESSGRLGLLVPAHQESALRQGCARLMSAVAGHVMCRITKKGSLARNAMVEADA